MQYIQSLLNNNFSVLEELISLYFMYKILTKNYLNFTLCYIGFILVTVEDYWFHDVTECRHFCPNTF